jgi:hypothetical protein
MLMLFSLFIFISPFTISRKVPPDSGGVGLRLKAIRMVYLNVCIAEKA